VFVLFAVFTVLVATVDVATANVVNSQVTETKIGFSHVQIRIYFFQTFSFNQLINPVNGKSRGFQKSGFSDNVGEFMPPLILFSLFAISYSRSSP